MLIQIPITLLASSVGVWLFYIQHQFEPGYWAASNSWSFNRAAIEGSSFFDLPWGGRWLTANIGIHHVHHLMPYVHTHDL